MGYEEGEKETGTSSVGGGASLSMPSTLIALPAYAAVGNGWEEGEDLMRDLPEPSGGGPTIRTREPSPRVYHARPSPGGASYWR